MALPELKHIQSERLPKKSDRPNSFELHLHDEFSCKEFNSNFSHSCKNSNRENVKFVF